MVRLTILLGVLFLAAVFAAVLLTRDEPTSSGAADLAADGHWAGPAADPHGRIVFGELATPEPLPLTPVGDRSTDVEHSVTQPEPVQPVLPEAPLLVEAVYQAGGNPVVGAYVKVTSRDSLTRKVLSEEAGRTDNAGLCRVTSLLGTLAVAVWTDAHEFGQSTLQHNGGVELERIRIEVERLASVSGVVRDPDGQPIAGARVSSIISNAIGGTAVTSDQLGRFDFHDWPVSPLAVLSFDAGGYGQEGVTLIVEDDARWCVVGMSDEFKWHEGTAAYLEVELTPAMSIRGILVNSEGKPVSSGRARAFGVADSSSRILLSDESESITDSEGAFDLPGLRLDVAHLVICDAPGDGIAVRSAASTKGSIDLGTLSLSGSGRVTGSFVDRWERPISGALLELTLPDVASLVPGGIDDSISYGNPSKLVSSSQVSANGDFEVGGPSVSGLQLTVRLGFQTLWKEPVDLGAGDVDLGTVRIETEVLPITGQLVTSDGMPAQLDVMSSSGSLWARVESDRSGTFRFVTLNGAPHSVTLVQRLEDGLPVNRWTRDIKHFPVTLQAK